jgi:single-strand DNA-binding protein
MTGKNHCTFIGNLAKDPVMGMAGNAKKAELFIICNMNERWKNEKGEYEWKDVPRAVNIVAIGYQADTCEKYLKKGAAVHIEGYYDFNSWTDDQNQKKSAPRIMMTDLIMLGAAPKKESEIIDSALSWTIKAKNAGCTTADQVQEFIYKEFELAGRKERGLAAQSQQADTVVTGADTAPPAFTDQAQQ